MELGIFLKVLLTILGFLVWICLDVTIKDALKSLSASTTGKIEDIKEVWILGTLCLYEVFALVLKIIVIHKLYFS